MSLYTLKLTNLSFSYSKQVIFNSINYNIIFNSILLIKGSNGVGKTTLLKLLYGRIKPDKGKMDISYNTSKSVSKCYVPSNPMFMFLTGYITDELKFRGLNKLDKYNEIYKGNKHVNELSAGELKKISVDIAFYQNCEALLLDEPLMALDDEEVIYFKNCLLDLKSKGRAIIIATCEDYLDNIADGILELDSLSYYKYQ
ncbi:MAG: ATP-binding cassette domain-containing protein [Deferribacterota bacterium]|nr:ATP-binding cassette domain-containing protein [Deferribacterota bacterium]